MRPERAANIRQKETERDRKRERDRGNIKNSWTSRRRRARTRIEKGVVLKSRRRLLCERELSVCSSIDRFIECEIRTEIFLDKANRRIFETATRPKFDVCI